MRLLLNTLRTVCLVAARFLALLLILFGVHLLLTRVLPEVRRTAALLEQEPYLNSELWQLGQRLQAAELETATLEQRLATATRQQAALLQTSLTNWEERVNELRAQGTRLEQRLGELDAERAEYCNTYNPFKLWFCREVEARTAGLRDALTPVVSEVKASLEQAEGALGSTRAKLSALGRGDAQALGEEGENLVVLSGQIAKSHARARVLRDRVNDAEVRRAQVVAAAATPTGFLVAEWRAVWSRLVGIALIALLLPPLQRTLWFFVLMPLAERARPLQLSAAKPGATLVASAARRSLVVALKNGGELRVRAGYARPVEGHASSQLLYRWTAPFISYSAGLFLLTRLVGAREGQPPVSVTLASPHDSSSYLMRVDIADHPGVVIHPRYLVGIEGSLELRTVWRVFSLHAWATGQLRYVLLGGTGAVILEGMGDIVANTISESRSKIEQELVVGFDTQLRYRIGRTETFLPYLLGRVALTDDVFEGCGTYFWQKSTTKLPRSTLQRGLDAVFSAIGKLLGF